MTQWGGRHGQALVALTLATYGTTCHLCMEAGATSADHLVPRVAGGDDSIENLRPAHRRCNSRRGARSIEWFRRRYAPHLLPGALPRVDNVAAFSTPAAGHPAPPRPLSFGPENGRSEPDRAEKSPIKPEVIGFFTDRISA